MTIRKKLTLFYAGLLTLIVIGFGVAVFSVIRWAMIATIDHALSETATQIINNSSASYIMSGLGIDQVAPRSIVVNLASLDIFRASDVVVQAWNLLHDQPELFAESANLGSYSEPLDPSGLGKHEPYYNTLVVNGLPLRILTRPILITSGKLIGNIQVAASLQTVYGVTNAILIIMVISSLVALVGVIGLSMWFSHRALKPIDNITLAAAGIVATKDLKTRLPWNGPPDELGRLVSVFNHMMSRIDHLFSVQQRFVADVSHELRTPLTAIRGNLDIIRRYGMDEASLEAIESETERMSRLVNDLLLLARADYGAITLDLYPLDLDTVFSEVYQQARVLVKDRNLKVVVGKFEPARIMGNADRLKQLLLNLVGNAIKFTPDGGQITLGLAQENGQAVITVRDTGAGIEPQHLERIFDRFYQAEPSRNHSELNSGAGLGLSIAKWIAEAHGGAIRVESEPGKGALFTVTLPLEATPPTPAPQLPAPRSRLGKFSLSRPERDETPEPEGDRAV